MHTYTLAYFVVLAIHLVGQLVHFTWLSVPTKPLLMPLLMGLAWQYGRKAPAYGLLLAALGFSWLGDVLLMPSGGTFFVFGLAAFLLAHACYIWLFSRNATFIPLRLLPFVFYVVLLLSGPLRGKLPEQLRWPVYGYVLVLTGMGYVATLRSSRQPGFEQVVVGAVLFILSDSFLALNKFSSPLPLAGFWVMITYGLAQYFLVNGYLSGQDTEH